MERITKKKAIEIIGTAAALLLLFGIIWYVSSSVKKTPLISEDGLEYAKATVVEIVKGNSGGNNTGEGEMAGSQDVKVKITSGSHKGKTVEANNLNGYLYGANCQVGTKVIVQISAYGDVINANVSHLYLQQKGKQLGRLLTSSNGLRAAVMQRKSSQKWDL